MNSRSWATLRLTQSLITHAKASHQWLSLLDWLLLLAKHLDLFAPNNNCCFYSEFISVLGFTNRAFSSFQFIFLKRRFLWLMWKSYKSCCSRNLHSFWATSSCSSFRMLLKKKSSIIALIYIFRLNFLSLNCSSTHTIRQLLCLDSFLCVFKAALNNLLA